MRTVFFTRPDQFFFCVDSTVATAVLVLQTLVRSPSFPITASRANVITRLASYLYTGKVTDPVARSTVYWLVGQFAAEGLLEGCGPDVVRLGAKQFAEEASLLILRQVEQLLTAYSRSLRRRFPPSCSS